MNASARLTTHLPRELVRWLDGHGDDPTRAWRECPHAHWLLHLALAVHLDRALCVRAAADLAGAALSGRDVDASAASALRTALAWLDGGANASQAWACGFSAINAADREEDETLADAMRAAAFVAFACDDKADATFYAHRGYAAKAAEAAEAIIQGSPSAADRVRARIPVELFVDALAIASQPPPPNDAIDGEVEPATDSFYA